MSDALKIGDVVSFWSGTYEKRFTGKVVRLWDRPETDPYVTIAVMPGSKIFVRCSSALQKSEQ